MPTRLEVQFWLGYTIRWNVYDQRGLHFTQDWKYCTKSQNHIFPLGVWSGMSISASLAVGDWVIGSEHQTRAFKVDGLSLLRSPLSFVAFQKTYRELKSYQVIYGFMLFLVL